MYGKIFSSMFDGSLYGKWQAIVTFQQMIVLADQDGTIDISSEALSARTSIPLDIIKAGIAILEAPDEHSRSPDESGRRIVLVDPARGWGWQIVNYAHYRAIRTAEDRREYNRKYWHKRKKTQPDSTVTQLTQPIAEADTEARTTLSGEARRILEFLNEKTGRKYQPVKANMDKILARFKEGYTSKQLRQIIARKCSEWGPDEKMNVYLRPATLFNREKCAQYAGELAAPKEIT